MRPCQRFRISTWKRRRQADLATTILNDNSTDLQEEITKVLLPEGATTTTGNLRQSYADGMDSAPFNDKKRAEEILAKDVEQPIFEDESFGADELPDRKHLLAKAMDVTMDIATLDNAIVCATDKYSKLIVNTIGRLNTVKERLHQDEQRQQDIQFINDAYKGLSNVVQMTNENMTGSYGYYNNTFISAQNSLRQIRYTVEHISGNGYSGNEYVTYKDGTLRKNYDDTSNKLYLSDDSSLTTYEYSRLCSRNSRLYYQESSEPSNDLQEPKDVNHDDKDVICVIKMNTLNDVAVNMLVLDTDNNDIRILDVQVSDDGVSFRSALTDEIDLSEDAYHAMNYVAGSNIVCFPATKHLKLTLSSSHVNKDESLGMAKIEVVNGEPAATIYPMKNVVRKVIALNGIRLFHCRYTSTAMHSENVCPENGCNRVAVFCNQYIPGSISKTTNLLKEKFPVKYTLFINGKAYNVRPINSDDEGVKLISCKEGSYTESGVQFIDEPIKTIQLQVEFLTSKETQTAFIGNLKVCIG